MICKSPSRSPFSPSPHPFLCRLIENNEQLTALTPGVFDGVAVVVFGLLGLIFAIPLTLFDGGSVIGVGASLLWVIVAGCIILYKIIMKKRF